MPSSCASDLSQRFPGLEIHVPIPPPPEGIGGVFFSGLSAPGLRGDQQAGDGGGALRGGAYDLLGSMMPAFVRS